MAHRRRDAPPELHRLLTRQAGVIGRAQARSFMPAASIDRLLAQGSWSRLIHGIYTCLPTPTWHAWLWAGLVRGGDTAAASGEAALHLEGILPAPPPEILIVSESQVRGITLPLRMVRGTRATRGEPCRTRMEAALADAWPSMTEGDWLIAFGRAAQLGRTSPARFARFLEEHPLVPGHRRLVELAGEGGAGVRSPLERDYRHDVEIAHGLPTARRQARTAGGAADCLYEEFGVVVELDGRRGHETDRFRDMARDNRNAARGLLTLRFGWRDVRSTPCGVAAQVAQALQARGWSGAPLPCRRCARAA